VDIASIRRDDNRIPFTYRTMNRLANVAVALMLTAGATPLPAQLSAQMVTIPPVSREMYIMQSGVDSAAFGTFRRLLGDTIYFFGLDKPGMFSQRVLPLASIARIEMAEFVDFRAVAERGAVFGGLAGVAIGGGGAAIGGGRVMKSALIGALAGALFGYILGGQSAEGRVLCWRTIFQQPNADSSRYADMRRSRSPEPSCDAVPAR
jgi:hypothetical protein